MSLTPIYDQLRGERINADVPATETDLEWVDDPEERRLPVSAASAAAGSRPPEATADLAAHQPAAGWGPRAALALTIHPREDPAR